MTKAKTMAVLVKQIRCFKKDTKYAVFTGDIMRKKRNGTYVPTKNIQTFVGFIFSIYPGDRLTITARESENLIYGTQWKIQAYHREVPGTIDEIRKFLNQIPGIGPLTAKKLIDRFGLDVLDAIRSDTTAFDNLGLRKDACQKIRDEISANSCFEEILTFLQLNDLDYRYAFPIFKKYGLMSVRKMKDNPYALYYDHIIDFQTADKLNFALKNPAGNDGRLAAGLMACLQHDSETNGNLYLPFNALRSTMDSFLNSLHSGFAKSAVSEADAQNALDELVRANHVVIDNLPDTSNPSIYLRQNYWAETHIVETLEYLNKEPKRTAYQKADIDDFLEKHKPGNITLAPEQKKAVETALSSHISIITGGPGTGKTQTLNSLISVIRGLTPKAVIRLCAPTGKAALRISELTNMGAATIHRTLKMNLYQKGPQPESLECDFLIIDEFSMVDCFLCAKLFEAVASFARIVIVGDHEQLPSVGPGLVLRDMIDSGKIPVTRLTTIFRQGKTSAIVVNANRIIQNYGPNDKINLLVNTTPHKEFYFIQNSSVSQIQHIICTSVKKLMKDYHFSMDDIKVLSPIHGGDLGVDRLNLLLQNTFNPKGDPYERDDGLELRVGDPVLHLQNDYDLDVFNGETGVVSSLGYDQDKTLMVTYPGNRHVWYSQEQVYELDLAYAMTTHKSQGSEFKAVIMPMHESLLCGLSKNLIYTGITRAKKMVILVGSREAFSKGARKSTVIQRNSNLAARLQKT